MTSGAFLFSGVGAEIIVKCYRFSVVKRLSLGTLLVNLLQVVKRAVQHRS